MVYYIYFSTDTNPLISQQQFAEFRLEQSAYWTDVTKDIDSYVIIEMLTSGDIDSYVII